MRDSWAAHIRYLCTDIATLNGNYPDKRSVCKANEYEEEKTCPLRRP